MSLWLHVGTWTVLYALGLVLFRRPWSAAAGVLVLQLFVVLVSNAKYRSLLEPFIYQDVDYFFDALRHPRLYLPFFGFLRAALTGVAITAALVAGIGFEPSLAHGDFLPILFGGILILFPAGCLLIWRGCRIPCDLDLDPGNDLERLGLPAVLWLYRRAERKSFSLPQEHPFHGSRGQREKPLPNLVGVQCESFFDPRPFFPGVRPELLKHYDALKAAGVGHGRLIVPSRGANTVRTEFAFLSGLCPELLGIHKFNPYRKLVRAGVPNLAGFLGKLGYRTVCLHPYPATFYRRDKVFPMLGFDEFFDIDHFPRPSSASGPFVDDIAVAGRIRDELAKHAHDHGRPIFLFVITMENHGPLHLETVRQGDRERLYREPPTAGCDDLTIYLRHIENTDTMFGMVGRHLNGSRREGWLCLFGDHIPIMPEVYRRLGMPDGRSDYVIWTNASAETASAPVDLKVEQLAGLLMRKMGLAQTSSPSE